jgi:hypothetical protein
MALDYINLTAMENEDFFISQQAYKPHPSKNFV